MVIVLVAVLSVLLVTSFVSLSSNARFNNTKTQIVNMIQKARSLSLSNILINDTDPTDYYKLTLTGQTVTIDAYGTVPTNTESIGILNLDTDFSFASTLDVYYFPPYGDVCFNASNCSDSSSTAAVILSNADATKTATFTFDVNGGYVNVN
jgi:type II secretory pathway pseudopilin PulG